MSRRPARMPFYIADRRAAQAWILAFVLLSAALPLSGATIAKHTYDPLKPLAIHLRSTSAGYEIHARIRPAYVIVFAAERLPRIVPGRFIWLAPPAADNHDFEQQRNVLASSGYPVGEARAPPAA